LQAHLQDKSQAIDASQYRYSTHVLEYQAWDQIVGAINGSVLDKAESKVKVIFVPTYLNQNDGIFNKSYYELLVGMDLTIYPSYYEPWGYTPLESVAFHVPAITTDLAGFGLWVNSLKGGYSELKDGVKVIHRSDYNYSEVADAIKDTVAEFSALKDTEIKKIRKNAADIAEKALWKHFIKYYYEAYDIALRNAQKRLLSK
jgi:glycosyltransferase involved in cell wall biosynthesis